MALWIIGGVTIHTFLIEMSFEQFSFYIRHKSIFIWVSAWMLLFIYFHVCALRGRKLFEDDISKKTILLYLLATLDISFFLSLAYTLWGYYKFSLNVCMDSPSIWCTFYVVQIFALPLFLSAIPRILDAPKNKTTRTYSSVCCA